MEKEITLPLYFGQEAIIRDYDSEVFIIEKDGKALKLSTGDIFDIHSKLVKTTKDE